MIYLLCGRVGSGKSTFARRRLACPCLSCDTLLLRLFPPYLGEKHGEIQAKCTAYLTDLAVELAQNGSDAALDFGFWTRQSRMEAMAFFAALGLDARVYYFDPPERLRLDRLQGRDRAIREGRIRDCYPMEGGVREILDARFEVPLPSEVDVWIMG